MFPACLEPGLEADLTAQRGTAQAGLAVPHDLVAGVGTMLAVAMAAKVGHQAHVIAERFRFAQSVLVGIVTQEVEFVIGKHRWGSQSGTWRPSRVMTMMRQAMTALVAMARCNRSAVRNSSVIRTRLRQAGENASWTTLRRILEGQQRITATFRRADGRTLRVLQGHRAEPLIRRSMTPWASTLSLEEPARTSCRTLLGTQL